MENFDFLKETIAEEIFDNIGWDGMEFVVLADENLEVFTEIRQENSMTENFDEEVLFKQSLSSHYWNDVLNEWEIEAINDCSDSLKKDFIDEVILPYLDEIEY